MWQVDPESMLVSCHSITGAKTAKLQVRNRQFENTKMFGLFVLVIVLIYTESQTPDVNGDRRLRSNAGVSSLGLTGYGLTGNGQDTHHKITLALNSGDPVPTSSRNLVEHLKVIALRSRNSARSM